MPNPYTPPNLALFPTTLRGMGWPTKIPKFSTTRKKAASGKGYAIPNWTYPEWTWKIPFEFIKDTTLADGDFQTLLGFFLARKGDGGEFYYKDPLDNTASAFQFGTGDGTTKIFQLYKSYAGYTEPVYGVEGTPTVTVAGFESTAFTIDNRGKITFTSAPATGSALRWSGVYYHKVIFVKGDLELEQFLDYFWKAKRVELVTWK